MLPSRSPEHPATGAGIEPFDPVRALEHDLHDCFTLRTVALRVDSPEDALPTPETVTGRMREPLPELGPCLFWVARRAGRVVGLIRTGFPGDENTGLAMVETVVHPDWRRRGIGTALLRASLPAIRDSGRDVVIGAGLRSGGAGEAWVDVLGFRETRRVVMQLLDTRTADRTLWAAHPPPGYRLARWVDSAPEALVASYARARPAIGDAPWGESSYRLPVWTVERIRAAERELIERRVEKRVVVAVEEASGEVVGLTELHVLPHRPDHGYQGDTCVVAAHRGRGLARCVKAAMLRWLIAERPDLERVYTTTAESNTEMLNTNHRVGYVTVRTMIWVEHDVESLCRTVADRDRPRR